MSGGKRPPACDRIWVSFFCREMNLAVRAGMTAAEGVSMLLDGENSRKEAAVLQQLAQQLEQGADLHTAMERSGAFPVYAVQMTQLGELTGHLEDTLLALSGYYRRAEGLSAAVRSAVLYPSVLTLLLLAVVLILLTRVLPVFQRVYRQLGGSMPAAARYALRLGQWLGQHWFWVAAVLALAVGAAAAVCLNPRLRAWAARRGAAGRISRRLAAARFSASMAMTLKSGLDAEDSLTLSRRFAATPELQRRMDACSALLHDGTALPAAIQQTELLPPMDCRMLAVGFRTGELDTVMEEIAARLEHEAQDGLERAVMRIEPALVIGLSVIVGVVLLSVMLPLVSILSTLS